MRVELESNQGREIGHFCELHPKDKGIYWRYRPRPKASYMPTSHGHHANEDCLNCEHRTLRMFCNLTPEALEDFNSVGVLMNHARGAKLFSEGDGARNVFVMCSGQVKVSATSRDGKTMILKIGGPGDVLGLSAVLSNVPYEVTAEAIEPCMVKAIRKQEFIDFLAKHGIASMHAAQSLSGEYLTVFQDAKRLALSGSAAGRLARLLLDWAHSVSNGKAELRFTMALTHEEIANMAGTSRETVTRLLNQFRRSQLISIKGTALTILNPAELERMTA
jgi:CRP/FNR family transcriptional regulator, cyclic AMP receptor protein